MALGALLFIGSFLAIYYNEGRINYSDLAAQATEISATEQNPDSQLTDKLIYTTGTLAVDNNLSDDLFLIPQQYIALKRTVEIYAWVEDKTTKNERNSSSQDTNFNIQPHYQDTEYYYQYHKQWTATPSDSTTFNFPKEHQNPTKQYSDLELKNDSTKIGQYLLDIQNLTLPEYSKLILTPQTVNLISGVTLASDEYLFIGQGSLAQPQIGDTRISYAVVGINDLSTVFGKISGDKIVTYCDNQNRSLYRLFNGNQEAALAKLNTEYVTTLWTFRILSCLLMWLGLILLLNPLSAVFHLIPIFGKLFSTASQTLIRIVTLLIALILSVLAIVISILIHNILIVGLVLLGLAGLIIGVAALKRKSSIPPKTVVSH